MLKWLRRIKTRGRFQIFAGCPKKGLTAANAARIIRSHLFLPMTLLDNISSQQKSFSSQQILSHKSGETPNPAPPPGVVLPKQEWSASSGGPTKREATFYRGVSGEVAQLCTTLKLSIQFSVLVTAAQILLSISAISLRHRDQQVMGRFRDRFSHLSGRNDYKADQDVTRFVPVFDQLIGLKPSLMQK